MHVQPLHKTLRILHFVIVQSTLLCLFNCYNNSNCSFVMLFFCHLIHSGLCLYVCRFWRLCFIWWPPSTCPATSTAFAYRGRGLNIADSAAATATFLCRLWLLPGLRSYVPGELGPPTVFNLWSISTFYVHCCQLGNVHPSWQRSACLCRM